MRINKPGIYRGVDSNDYHGDPCPEPSLSQSLAKILIEKSPLHAFIAHPRLSTSFESNDDKKFDLGNVAHSLALGRGKEFELLPFDDWRTKAAKEAREKAAAAGKIGVLKRQYDEACNMVFALKIQISNHDDSDAFIDGDAEVMLAWQENGIWFRSLVDWLHTDLRTVDDLKTSGMSMAPHLIGYRAEAAGWHIQAAFIERGLDVLDPDNAGRRRFRFVAQETSEPFAITVAHLDEYWLTMGRKQVATAVNIWRQCIESGNWPAYTARSIVPVFPGYKEKQWLDREMSGEFDPSLIMAG
jgi:hypothetical protein